MLIALGVITVFTILTFLLRKGLKEEPLLIAIPLIFSALSLYGFLFVDYKISSKQPYDTIKTEYPLQVFEDGKIIHVEKGAKQRIHQYVKFNDDSFDAGNFEIKETTEEPYVLETHKKAKKDSIWLIEDIDTKDYVFYVTEEIYNEVAKDILALD